MKRRLPPLTSLRTFEAAARHMSFSRAAAELNVTQGAISRQIKTLEDYLGVGLFRRLPRSLELTDEGQHYLATVVHAFEQLHQATEAMLDGKRMVTLNANVLPTFAMRWLIPRLPAFAAANPATEVRMVTSIKPVNFKHDDHDVAIRVGPGLPGPESLTQSPIDLLMTDDWSDVRAVPLLPDELVVVAVPALRDVIREPRDLKRHTLLHTASREKAWTYWLRQMGLEAVKMQSKNAYGHFFMTLQAAIAGKGVAIVPRILAEGELETGSLVTLFGGASFNAGAYYLLCRASEWQTPKVARFREWILAEAAKSRGGNAKATRG
jgi:LysR family glycine cleavage system transcriptional activator